MLDSQCPLAAPEARHCRSLPLPARRFLPPPPRPAACPQSPRQPPAMDPGGDAKAAKPKDPRLEALKEECLKLYREPPYLENHEAQGWMGSGLLCEGESQGGGGGAWTPQNHPSDRRGCFPVDGNPRTPMGGGLEGLLVCAGWTALDGTTSLGGGGGRLPRTPGGDYIIGEFRWSAKKILNVTANQVYRGLADEDDKPHGWGLMQHHPQAGATPGEAGGTRLSRGSLSPLLPPV